MAKEKWTLATLTDFLSHITYLDWQWVPGTVGRSFYIQLKFMAPDTESGFMSVQKGGKFLVSKHAARNEVLRTAHAAITSAVLDHEYREEPNP